MLKAQRVDGPAAGLVAACQGTWQTHHSGAEGQEKSTSQHAESLCWLQECLEALGKQRCRASTSKSQNFVAVLMQWI